MPGSMREVANAEEEGVVFEWLAAPARLPGDAGEGRRREGARACAWARPTPPAARRRKRSRARDFDLPADLVIKALGFDPEDLPTAFGAPDLGVTRWGTREGRLRARMMTTLDGVFAAGDIVRGASLVVWAIRDGRDAADAIHRYLQADGAPPPAPCSRRSEETPHDRQDASSTATWHEPPALIDGARLRSRRPSTTPAASAWSAPSTASRAARWWNWPSTR